MKAFQTWLTKSRPELAMALAIVIGLGTAAMSVAQSLPNPYRCVDGWAKMPEGRPMGAAAEYVAVNRDGNLYGGEARTRRIQKYVRVRP